MKSFRGIIGDNKIRGDETTSDASVLAKLDTLSPSMHITFARLRLFIHFLWTQPVRNSDIVDYSLC